MPAFRINIILFGIGNVGSTLINQVLDSQSFFLEKSNIDLRFPVITNSTMAFFEKEGLKNQWEANFAKAAVPFQLQDILEYLQEQQLDNLIAVDATASEEIIKSYIPLIQNGFHIVAANKKANTQHFDFYKELRRILQKHDQSFLYETNVGGGLPVVKTLRDLYLSGDKITKIRGVFSGSLSYIFNRLAQETTSFSSILKDAQKLGLTEPDPRDDLSGKDVARKLLILLREIGLELELNAINVESLLPQNLNSKSTKSELEAQLPLLDQQYKRAKIAQADNHVLRYVGEFDVATQKTTVQLVSVPQNSALGQLQGSDNLIEIYTLSYGEIPIVIQGAGAGKQVTARGILNDILQIAATIKIKEAVW